MNGYRKRESRARKARLFSPTADKVNLQTIRRRQPRGGRCL